VKEAQAHKLIVSSADQESASISPDGRRIAFESDRSGAIKIWVCDGDGSNVLRLTSFGVMSGTPRWSPDGGLIAFDSRLGGESNLYTVDPAGGVPTKLNIDVPDNSVPSWSPDGKWIRPIFTLEKSSPYWIGAMPVSPDGKWMLFPQLDGIPAI
jgi:Tol biopolymer transport system component